MLLDSNIVIYAGQRSQVALRSWVRSQGAVAISSLTRIEALGTVHVTPQEEAIIAAIFGAIRLLPISEPVIEQAIKLRRRRRMKLADAIIAATALVHHLPLATHNTDDFKDIPDLQIHDPLSS